MALALPTPPSGHADALARALARLREHVGERPSALGPFPVYALTRADLCARRLLDAARLVAWRSVLRRHGTREQHTLELLPPEHAGEPWRVGALRGAADAAALLEATHVAQEAASEGEARLLVVTSPALEALWMHAESGDVLVPLDAAGPGLRARARYGAAEVLAVLAPEARRLAAEGAPETN